MKATSAIQGSFVLFLRPDNKRFDSYADLDENIYDADSDFGVGISNTMDSISKCKKYQYILSGVTEKRFIEIKDCKNCPPIIDRDTINYGVLFATRGKEIKIITLLHSGDYLSEVEDYFNIVR